MKKLPKSRGESIAKRRRERQLHIGMGGVLAGAAIGALAGLPGTIAGALIGGLYGFAAGRIAAHGVAQRDASDRQIDEEIGIYGGDLGAPNLKHPSARIGRYSASSMGVGTTGGGVPAEGPIPSSK